MTLFVWKTENTGWSERLVPLGILLSVGLASAHFWRFGQTGMVISCLGWGVLSLGRSAWVRPVTVLLLFVLSGEWFVTANRFVQLRMMLGEPWLRLACILLGVAAFTLLTALLVWERPGRLWFRRQGEHVVAQVLTFMLVVGMLLVPLFLYPKLFLAERLVPGFGSVQVVCAGVWGSFVCRLLMDRRRAPRIRLRIWRLFSLIFFGQFALAALGYTVFYMTGEPHIPVPGVIVGGAIYRGAAGFMLLLFLASVLLVGSAWCSHLCYLGGLDTLPSARADSSPRHPLLWRAVVLVLVCTGALLLRLCNAPTAVAVAGGLALGFVMLPLVLLGRRKGYAIYCTMVCPLGLLACLLGRLSLWRIHRTEACVMCGKCTRVCRYGALNLARLKAGAPGLSCTLCRDCLSACPHGGLGMSWAGKGLSGRAEQAFVVLVSAMHAVFLFSAMV